jgi:hypothetical protein
MSANVDTINETGAVTSGSMPTWLWLGVGTYLLLVVNGGMLLNDSDTYWHIVVGRWILDHGAFPQLDIYSFTKAGEPWVSSSWLAQVLYAEAHALAGWAGPVILAAVCTAVTFAYLAFILGRRLPATYAIVVALVALVLSIPHLLARPHVLALPVMLAWVNGLVSASERHEAPSFWLLPLLALWANLHGGFVFGLALVAALAVDALWSTGSAQRRPLARDWVIFGVGAAVACCATPYGWGSILASRKILELGDLLHLIYEWMPVDFSHLSPFVVCVFVLIGAALHFGVKLSPPRLLLVLGLLHMAVSHVRNIEVFALLVPLVALSPLASQFHLSADRLAKVSFPARSAAMVAAIFGVSSWAFAASHTFLPAAGQSPVAAVKFLKEHNAQRILNDLPFGGYLISRDIPVFIDGRAELYGERFEMAFYRAVQLQNVNLFLGLLKDYNIDAVLLTPSTPAVTLLDHLDGWQRVYSDEVAVVHMRTGQSSKRVSFPPD